MSRGKRYDTEPKLNLKKVIATIIAIAVITMFIISLKNLLLKSSEKEEFSTMTTYYSAYSNGKWGVIDNKGSVIIDLNYKEMIVVPDKKTDLFIVTYDVNYENGTYKTKILDKNGREKLSNFNNVQAIENYNNNEVWYESNVLKYQKNGKWGLITFDGKEIIPADYDKIYALPGIQKSIIIEKDGLVGLVSNSLGEIVIKPNYAEITSLTNTYDNGYIVKNKDSYYGIITTDKKTILNFKYDDISHVTGGDMYVVTEEGKTKLIKKDGETVLDSGFDEIISIDGDSIIIKKDGKYGVIKVSGTVVIPLEYDDLKYTFDRNYIAKKNDKYGIIKSGNETIIDFKYLSATYRKEANFIEAETEDYKTDIIDSSFNTVLSGVIISEVNREKGYIRVRLDDEYQYYNFKFEKKKTQDVLTTNTLFLVKENGKYGYENKNGNKVVDCIYDDATEQNELGYVAVNKDGLWGSLKSNGSVALNPSVNLNNNLYIDFINDWHSYEELNMNVYTK